MSRDGRAGSVLVDALERQCGRQGTAVAWVVGEQRVSFEEYRLRAARLSGGLSQAGVERGDRVAVLLYNGLEIGELLFALARLGAIAVPLNFRQTPAEHRRVLQDAAPVAIISEPELSGALAPLLNDLPSVRLRVSLGHEVGWRPYAQLLAAEPIAPIGLDADDPAWLIYTSGTTGEPKGVTLSHGNLATMCQVVSRSRAIQPGVRFLLSMPQCHIGGAAVTLVFPFAGATATVLRHFSAGAALDAIERERITQATFAPTMLISLVRSGQLADRDLSSLELISYASAPMPLPWLRAVMAAFRTRFWQGYGLTEACGYVTALGPEDHLVDGPPEQQRRLASAGRPMEGVEVRVVDDADRDVPPGEVGEVLVRSPMVMLGYWGRPEATATALRGGWLHTGDLARLDDGGYLYIVDRKKDIIISGGLNIPSLAVEQALLLHPGVLEAAVVGVPDDHWGEAVKAFVVPRPGLALVEAELVAWCREHLAGYMKPRHVELRASLPKTAAGKVRKELLRLEETTASQV